MSNQKDASETLRSFISQNPNAQYTFVSQHGSPYTDLCRQDGENSRQCVTLKMYSTQMFEAMQASRSFALSVPDYPPIQQKYGFFCALPSDPSRTHMVCRKLPRK
ncbi:hypothetical protein F5I97DRAFT_608345 [Phlebopus sp. FC_14]|nr:hypothetical protein F5I97DRAFT_608345 [Phlebopus sp. FC_14]